MKRRARAKSPKKRTATPAKNVVRTPRFGILSAEQCLAVLGRNHVGRIAFVNEGLVDIEPVSYVAGDSWIFVRSAAGAKMEALAHTPYAAFEVDEAAGPFDWHSVVARGTVYVMSSEGSRVDRADFERALTALRSFMPGTLTAGDPTPHRQTVYGLHVDRLVGRMASSRGGTPNGARDRATPKPAPGRKQRTPDGF